MVFLAALAIVDDLGAVPVIALLYTVEIAWAAPSSGALFLALLIGANSTRARHPVT